MNPESDEARDEHGERDAIARAYREASHAIDERPDPRVRAAVLAAAARAVDAKPTDAAHRRPANARASHPFSARRWPLSAAALLVVSIMAGLVATRGWWERPDLVDANQQQRATPEAPAQSGAPTPSVTTTAGMLGPPAATDTTQDRNARQEPETKAPGRTRRAPGAASPKRDDANQARVTPEATAPLPAGQISSDTTRRKSEAPAKNAGAAPAAPGVAQPAVARPADARPDSRDEADTPDVWVARIVKLREAGKHDDADREVTLLKQRYPAFAIPRQALRATGTR